MKFVDILMREQHRKRLDLEEEVVQLQQVLDKEQKVNQILQCAFQGPIIFCSCLSSLLPGKVHEVLVELAMLEEDIVYLEREVADLKVNLYEERRHDKECNFQQKQQNMLRQNQHAHFQCTLGTEQDQGKLEQSPLLADTEISCTKICGTFDRCDSTEEDADSTTRLNKQFHNQRLLNDETGTEDPNKLSEELVKILICTFHKLNQTSNMVKYEQTISPKVAISCISSRNFMYKSSFSCKTATCSSKSKTKLADPYGILSDIDVKARDIGSYRNFIHFTRSSFDMSRVSLCLPAISRLRTLMHKLSTVELCSVTYKQKLAFWINIYNASIMHAFLKHGPPPSSGKLLRLLNKAALNVGGIVLNALAIEHFILSHSSETQNETIDGKEALLRHAYGLDYPEPNVTFALCRGSWSSPVLRVYTAENVVNELEKAKVEYLDASIGISSKRILVPKLLHWHMRDFADDVESLLEWIYSQLPRSGSLKHSIMDCLSRDSKIPLSKLVEMQHYDEEFRYLLPPISDNSDEM